jgi:hypothetical protein
MNIPANLRYTSSHEWVRTEADGTVSIGITDHAQAALGDLVYVELPEVGRKVGAAEACAVVESVKAPRTSTHRSPARSSPSTSRSPRRRNRSTRMRTARGSSGCVRRAIGRCEPPGRARLRGVDRRCVRRRARAVGRSNARSDSHRAFDTLASLEQDRRLHRAAHRHDDDDQTEMLAVLGYPSRAALMDGDRPAAIPPPRAARAAGAISEAARSRACGRSPRRTSVLKSSSAGLLRHAHARRHLRNVLEKPGLVHRVHAVSAGNLARTLEALVNFQTMVCDLTGMAIANASMLDEATARRRR